MNKDDSRSTQRPAKTAAGPKQPLQKQQGLADPTSRKTTPEATPPATTAERTLAQDAELRASLIALNAHPKLPRAAICALGSHPEVWLPQVSSRPTADVEEAPVGNASRATAPRSVAEIGVSHSVVRRALSWLKETGARAADTERERAEVADVRIITRLDSDYPPALRDLSLPPPVLYVDGRIPTRSAIAVVGSRRADAYGLEISHRFSSQLAEAGLTIVSGYARGIDAAAHRGALDSTNGRTVAVLGCGIDVEYPRTHRSLAREIRERGALVTEFPFSTEPRAHHFPIRNRLIAALSHGTLVVRAAVRSGSLITARLALDLGRDVYAVPGNIFDPGALGPNTLIRDGALLAQHPRDILEALSLYTDPNGAACRPTTSQLPPPRTGRDGRLLDSLAQGSLSPDALASRTGLPIDEILTRLLELELGGYVERLPGPLFARTR